MIHQIGLPYHWSSKGLVRGDAANDLISFVADPNVSIQESKAFTGDIEPGRSSKGRRRCNQRSARSRDAIRCREQRDIPKSRGTSPESAHGLQGSRRRKEGNV